MTNCKTERFQAEVAVEEYVESCVAVEEFLEFCKACPNYQKTWSCPEFDFHPLDYWKRYTRLKLVGLKIVLPEEIREKKWTKEEQENILYQILWEEKQKLTEELYEMEKEIPGSVSLSAGFCQLCGGTCSRIEGKPCRHPDRIRYSIEALGGNVGLTVTRYLHQKLEWIEEGKMPHYFMLVCGLLCP